MRRVDAAVAAGPPSRPVAERPVSDPVAADALLVLRNGLREIAGEIRNSIDFHRAQESGNVVDEVVLSGAALEISGFAAALETELGHPVTKRTVALSVGSEMGGVHVERLTIAAGLAVEEVPA